MNSQDSTVMADLQAIRANYSLTSEQRQIVDHVDRVSREVLHPLQARMDAEDWWPDDLFKQMGELGLLGITAPEEMGGSGQNEFTQALVSEVISKWNPAVGLSHGAHDNLCLNNLLRNGSEEQVKKYVPGLCSGDLVGALGLTEPGAGSDALGSMATTARRDGEDYIINGSKIYITNGPIADVVLLYAKTDKSKGAKGISAFIIETDNPGFKVAQKLDKMGFRGSPTGELVFDECRVLGLCHGGCRKQRCISGDERVGSGARDGHFCLRRHGRAGAGTGSGVCKDPRTIRQTHRKFPDGSVETSRDLHRGRNRPRLQLSRAGGLCRFAQGGRRTWRDSQADRRRLPLRGRSVQQGRHRSLPHPWRFGLHAGHRDQPVVPRQQTFGDRCGHQ